MQFLDNLWDKQEGKCAITGEPLLLQLGKNKALPNKCSIDRINNSRGYNKDNVWFVAWWVNSMKSDMPLEVFAERIRKLADNLDKVDKKIK